VTNAAASSTDETSSPSVTVFAPAKINLILRILDRRPDGYHNLWSVMQTVALEDRLEIRSTTVRGEIRLHCDVPGLAVDQTNLVHRAAAAMLDRAQSQAGLEITLSKRIPMGAGLGGGSSDAAATLLGVNRVLKLGWSPAQLSEVGQPLGSDVPFFLYAPTASIAGRGELVKPISLEGAKGVLLVNPGFGVETKWAYQELAATRGSVRSLSPVHQGLDRFQSLTWSQLIESAENDFEAPVFSKHGSLRDIKQALLGAGAELALLSGSGATVFGVYPSEAAARAAAAQFTPQRGLKVFVVSTCSGPLVVAPGS